MKSKVVHTARKGYHNMYNFYMVKMFGIFKYSGSLYVRTGTFVPIKRKRRIVMNKTVFCAECRKDVNFVTKETVFKRTLKDNEYSFIGLEAYCAECGSPIYVSEIEDNNLSLLYDAYRSDAKVIIF